MEPEIVEITPMPDDGTNDMVNRFMQLKRYLDAEFVY